MLGEVPLSDRVLRTHAQELVMLGYDERQVLAAVRALRIAPVPEHMRRRPPLSGDIHNYLRPHVAVDDEADRLMQQVMGAIARYGYMQGALAREALGEVAWLVVDRMGGWSHLCSATPEGCTATKAQVKKSLAQALRADATAQRRAQLATQDAKWQLEAASKRAPTPGFAKLSTIAEDLCLTSRAQAGM